MEPSVPPRIEDDRRVWRAFRYHSRTFSAAARLLPRPLRMPIATLYLFCRTVDDIADHSVVHAGPARALDQIHTLRRRLDATLDGRPPPARFLWRRLHRVHRRFDLYTDPLYELIDGAVWDLEGRPVESRRDLIDYANLVGGSIGAMMLPLLLEDRRRLEEAEAPARALGIAMQLTNIVRDVGEDYRHLGRVYLPAAWLRAYGLSPADLGRPALPDAYPALLEDVMTTAEDLYREGFAGIDLLPPAMRTGIRAAARMYREIHNEVRALGYDNLSTRAFVPAWRKGALVLRDGYERRKVRLARQRAQVPA